MVWSPLSNLLLYGETADVSAGEERRRDDGARPGLVAEREQEPPR